MKNTNEHDDAAEVIEKNESDAAGDSDRWARSSSGQIARTSTARAWNRWIGTTKSSGDKRQFNRRRDVFQATLIRVDDQELIVYTCDTHIPLHHYSLAERLAGAECALRTAGVMQTTRQRGSSSQLDYCNARYHDLHFHIAHRPLFCRGVEVQQRFRLTEMGRYPCLPG